MPRSNRSTRGRLVSGLSLLAVLGAFSGGCATVKPWQRARLADPCMTFEASAAMTAYASHWQEAREGSSGGMGVQGGGCGCK